MQAWIGPASSRCSPNGGNTKVAVDLGVVVVVRQAVIAHRPWVRVVADELLIAHTRHGRVGLAEWP